jgi:hypothetical protein
VTIGAAAGFSASAGAGFGISAGVSIGASAGAGVSFGASAGAGASAGVSASLGGQASAGVSATGGAFGGLSTVAAPSAGRYFDPTQIPTGAAASAVSSGAVFDVTGRALADGGSGFQADVGATSTITFDAL